MRSNARTEGIPPDFRPARQIATTSLLATAILAVSLYVARGAHPAAWLLLPGVWLFANFFEWMVHRYPMHRPMFPRMMYRNHAQLHHLAFTEDTMAMDQPRELSLVMMPWYTIALLFIAVSPVAAVAAVLGGVPLAGIFYAGAISYFVLYETLHALYHVAPERLRRYGLAPDGWFGRLRAHHTHHHVLRRMAHVNFNVTFPIADVVLGTRERPEAVIDRARSADADSAGAGSAVSSSG